MFNMDRSFHVLNSNVHLFMVHTLCPYEILFFLNLSVLLSKNISLDNISTTLY